MRTCANCGTPINGKRANARYCTKSCRNIASRRRKHCTIPAVMRQKDRWVTWKPVRRGQTVAKTPMTTDSRMASVADPGTWAPYEHVAHLERKGFVLGDGIGCIDLDHCIEGGQIAGWAADIIEEYKQSAYLVEVSPSGTGIHIFTHLPDGPDQKIRDGRNIEVYPPCSRRYICVSGKEWHACS